MVKGTIRTAIPALAGGGIMAAIDAKLIGNRSTVVRVLAKLAAATAAGVFLRKKPQFALPMMGAMLGTLGYEQVARMMGGVSAASPPRAISQMASLVREDPRAMSALVTQVNGMKGMRGLKGMRGVVTTPSLGAPNVVTSPSLGGTAIPTPSYSVLG